MHNFEMLSRLWAYLLLLLSETRNRVNFALHNSGHATTSSREDDGSFGTHRHGARSSSHEATLSKLGH